MANAQDSLNRCKKAVNWSLSYKFVPCWNVACDTILEVSIENTYDKITCSDRCEQEKRLHYE